MAILGHAIAPCQQFLCRGDRLTMFIGSFCQHDRFFYHFHFAFPGMDRYKRRAVLLSVIRGPQNVARRLF
ncbi:hypothetical protein DWV07_17610 [Dickeya zeae]|nr:hypothetical protein DWV07_17610 [Dickeya zeae]